MLTKVAIPFFISKPIRLVVAVLVLLVAASAFGQNTKGDKPATTSTPSTQKKKLFGKKQSGSRFAPAKGIKRSDRVSNKPLPGAPVNTSPPSGRSRAYTKTISGGRITAPRSTSGKIRRVYPQRGPFVNNPSPSPEKSASRHTWPKGRTVSGQKLPSATAKPKYHKNVFPQRGPFVNNPSAKPKRPDAKPRNQPLYQARQLSMSKAAAQARSMGIKGAGFKTITARFITRRKNDVYWGKVQKKGDVAFKGDITGRKIRTLDHHSPKIGLVGTDTLPFARRSPRQIKGRKSQPLGGYQSATRTGRAWKGNISGGPIKKRTFSGVSEKTGKFVWPRKLSISAKLKGVGDFIHPRPKAATRPSPKIGSKPVPGKPPGIGGIALMSFSKRASALKKPKGFGGSISNKMHNNKPIASQGVSPSSMRISRFSGNIKSGRPLHGGGSVSGKVWNNKRSPIAVKQGGPGSFQGGTYRGFVKSRGPVKGAGGSISGKIWNNKNNPIEVRRGGPGTLRAGNFQGNIKTRRPEKGGGSVSGKLWNNKNNPIEVRVGGTGTLRAGHYQGNIKTKRPEKGGGSVSGKLWNNKNNPIEVRVGGQGTLRAGHYQGNIKTKRPEKGGGSVSGKLWNNKNQPIEVHVGGKGTQMAGNFQGRTKYQKPPETAGKPAKYPGNIKGQIIGAPITQIGLNFTGLYKAKNYTQNPKADKESLRKVRSPGGLAVNLPILNQQKRSVNAGHYVHVMKQYWNYKRGPNSPKEALKLREPGKATARIGDLQVNVKMKKHYGNELHPDARFANSYRDNVKEERTLLMNIKLTWSKLFKKSDTQPRNLKEKPSKPRYDPAEKGLWYK